MCVSDLPGSAFSITTGYNRNSSENDDTFVRNKAEITSTAHSYRPRGDEFALFIAEVV